MKRGGALALILFSLLFTTPLALSATVTQEDKLIYDKWHYSGDSFLVEGETLSVTHLNWGDTKIYLSINSKAVLLNINDCYETDFKKYCFKEIFNNIADAETKDPIKFDGRYVYAGLRIQIYNRPLELTVTRSFKPTNPTRDSEVEVEIKISNPTEHTAENFKYTDIYPEGVIIMSGSNDFEKSLHGVSYSGHIEPQTSKTLYYSIKILDYIAFTNIGTAEYQIAGVKKNYNTTKYTIDLSSQKPYTYTTTFSPATPETGQQTELTISVTNKRGSSMLFEDVSLALPTEDMSVNYDPLTFKKNGNVYYWTDTLKNGTKKDLTIKLTPLKSGKMNIPINIRVKETDRKSYQEKKNITMTANYKEPELILSVKEPSVSEGGKFRVAFSIKNPNTKTAFKNVNAIVRSNITQEQGGFVDQILPGNVPALVQIEDIIAPTVETATDYYFTATGRYDTNYETGKTYLKTAKVTINPINKSITITQTLTAPKQVRVGDNITVLVKVKHTNQEIVTADASDAYSQELVFNGGSSVATLYFDNPTDKQAYVYNLIVPYNYTKNDLFIRTDVSVREKPGVLSKITILPVNLTRPATLTPLPNNTLNNSQQQAANTEVGKNASENKEDAEKTSSSEKEEEGTMIKIVNGVTNFFRRLFGMEPK
jgi:hypothetical protein